MRLIRRQGGPDFPAADVNPGGVGMHEAQRVQLGLLETTQRYIAGANPALNQVYQATMTRLTAGPGTAPAAPAQPVSPTPPPPPPISPAPTPLPLFY